MMNHEGEGKLSAADPKKLWATMLQVWDYEHTDRGFVTEERIINDIDKVAQAICQVIAHSGTVVKALDKRNGHRKVASRLFLAGKLLPQAAAALRDQYKMWEGLSGPRPAAPAGPAGQA